MIICRTPFRVSFFGGGTDYPAWYREHGGAVLAAAINKYCYITCRYLPPFFDYKYRVRYFLREEASSLDEIKHPSVRECLKFMEVTDGVDLVHHGDLPARSGLGSSSSFTVGLLHALYALKHRMPTKRELAIHAIHIEQDVLRENVGSQDQATAAFGGFNRIEFGGRHEITVKPMVVHPNRIAELESHLLLLFTGFARTASEIAHEQIQNIPDNGSQLRDMMGLVEDAERAFVGGDGAMREIGRLLHEQWKVKRTLSRFISSDHIDALYEAGMRAGAWGGKLLGAGGGGFIMFLAAPQSHAAIKSALQGHLNVQVRFDFLGSQIVYYSRDDYF